MSEFSDLYEEDYYIDQIIFQRNFEDYKEVTNAYTKEKLVTEVLKRDQIRMDDITVHFPAYNVALKHVCYPHLLTSKQTTAMANVLAYYMAKYD